MTSIIIQAALWLAAIAAVVGTYYAVRPKRRSVQAPEGPTSAFCPHCGKALGSATRFCGECGAGVPVVAAVPSWSAIRILGLACGILVSLLLFVCPALFIGAGSTTKGIWTTTNSQLAEANATTQPQDSSVSVADRASIAFPPDGHADPVDELKNRQETEIS